MAERYAPLVDAATEIKLEATTAHLWFEEIISGDRSIDIEGVWKHLDQAEWYAQAMLEGGENQEGKYIPLEEPALRYTIEQTLEGIRAFRLIARERWKAQTQSGAGSDIDQRFDKTFDRFLVNADDVETALKRTMERQWRKFRFLQGLLFAIILILGVVIGVVLLRQERRRTSDMLTLQDREEKLRTTLNSIGDAVITTDTSGNIIRMNPVAETLTGWRASEVAGCRPLSEVFKIINAQTREPMADLIEKVLSTDKVVSPAKHTVLISKDGVEYQIASSSAAIRATDGNITGIVLVFRDATEEHTLQAALKEYQLQLQSILDNTPAVIYVKDIDGRYLLVNRQFETLFNTTNAKIRGLTDHDFFPHNLADKFRENDNRVLKTQTPLEIEEIAPHNDGLHTYTSLKFPLFDSDNAVNAICGISTDITERKHHEKDIENIAAGVMAGTGDIFFRHLVEHLPTIFNADYTFIGVLDKSENEHINTLVVCAHGKIVDNMSYPLRGTPCANVLNQSTCAYPSGVQQQFPEDRILEIMGVEGYIGKPLFDSRGEPLGLLAVMDSKPLQRIEELDELLEIFAARAGAELERMLAVQALRKSEQRLNDAQRMAHIGSWELDTVTNKLEWSEEIYRIFEIDRQEFDASYEAFLNVIHPEDREKVNAAYSESVRNKTPYNIEHRLRMPDGTIKHVLEHCETFYDDQGTPVRSTGTVQDVSERVSMEDSLRRSQKMEAIGKLSSGIAHDFNNQLGVVIGYLDLLKNIFPDDEKPRQWVNKASKATLRCMDLTRQLLTFSRRQIKKKTVVNLNATLKGLETMIARSVTPEIEVQYVLAGDLWLTEIDPGEFQDVILNLVINARDAMPDGGKLLIETTNSYLDADYAARSPGIEAGNYVQLMLSDTGTGMDKGTLEHVFEPFFTTKPEGKGTGLGMAMVYGFIKRYGGSIKLYSELGAGTTVRLYLPRSMASESTVIVNNGRAAELPTGSETILIVDDEVDLLQLADHYLSDLGYHTYTAENAAQALDIVAKEDGIDLLFSDVVMPGGMNGYQLAQRVSELRPNLKVLLTSGFTSKTIAHNGQAHILSKPYRKSDLAQGIRLALDEALEEASSLLDARDTKENLVARTILVIDDEEDVRELFQLSLEKLGCKTLLASNGDEAIALYRRVLESGEPIDATILDLTLPGGMGGKEIAGKIQALDPHAKMIVASGHTQGPEMTHYRDYGYSAALDKSFNREKIKQVLEQVLSSS